MTRSIRAYRAAATCEEVAEQCEAATLRQVGAAALDLAMMAKRYRRNADEWRRIAAQEGAKERAARRSCWCGRTITNPAEMECAEHDGPLAVRALTAV